MKSDSLRATAAAVVAAVVLCAAQATAQPPSPTEQPVDVQKPVEIQNRFVKIDNALGFNGFFNIGQGAVRIVALMSPTCPRCVAGFEELSRIMKEIPSRRLRPYVVFMPVLEGDTPVAALELGAKMLDRRASYFWDPNVSVRDEFQALTGKDVGDLHVCFLFDTDAVIRDKPDQPVWWMEHAADGSAFNSPALEANVRELLDRLEENLHKGDKEPSEGE